jgi:hypothetical protein
LSSKGSPSHYSNQGKQRPDVKRLTSSHSEATSDCLPIAGTMELRKTSPESFFHMKVGFIENGCIRRRHKVLTSRLRNHAIRISPLRLLPMPLVRFTGEWKPGLEDYKLVWRPKLAISLRIERLDKQPLVKRLLTGFTVIVTRSCGARRFASVIPNAKNDRTYLAADHVLERHSCCTY